MKNRREMRIETIICLYQFELLDGNLEMISLDTINQDSKNLFLEILKNKEAIDQIIEENLENYSFSRLSIMDKAIIRLATYELKLTDTPAKIVINEAVEITKKYSDLDDEKQHKFTNKLLDSIARSKNE